MSDSENEPFHEAPWLEATARWSSMTGLQRFEDDEDDDATPYAPFPTLTEEYDLGDWIDFEMPRSDAPPLWQGVIDVVEFIERVLRELNIDDNDRKAQNYAYYEHFSIDRADDGAWYARWNGQDERITFDSNDEEKLKNILLEYILLRCPTKSPNWTQSLKYGY